ncbi:hypothetical protein AGR4A_pAt10333 [Agrobacterium tumefaciens str. B6]|uniref:Uncharacterized protein n=1 Tax=Agrobacterium tumefaciens str. B6 TaxID=1183423 RepID=A0A822V8M4_AGRTU|nr:hypothetical protein ASB65_15835 [Agrobacterium tumefaciens str. B6]MQB27432.1 hypothetical protein [Agrobacterium tumefaciens]OCJ39603.1 hypothetical protein A6U90_20125 [Agrobacterium tumefaciens]CVI24856.1 hypothetical protein AGR4A_pAt10333 [Agrobacterium tumefaciens str. B6]SPZ48501.1 Uncharacterised protein [Agrobacterium tumefaciens]
MTKTFLHSFAPSPASPITGATVDLDVADIEVAGIREVFQGSEQDGVVAAPYSAGPPGRSCTR